MLADAEVLRGLRGAWILQGAWGKHGLGWGGPGLEEGGVRKGLSLA